MDTKIEIDEDSKNENNAGCFNQWAAVTTCHGAPDIGRARGCSRKVLWTIAFLISFGMLVNQLLELYNDTGNVK
jgi:hypothetical protein